jgi:hypothetical protein
VAIVAFLLFWFPVIGAGATFIALILGIIAWVVAGKSHRPTGLAIAATVISALGLVISLVITIWFFHALINDVRDAERYCDPITNTQAAYDDCVNTRAGDSFLNRFGIEPSP